MTVELCPSEARFLTTEWVFTRAVVPIHTGYEDSDPELRAFFEECRQSGRPYIDHHEASGTFRYVYFNRSETPSPELMARLDALGLEFGLAHRQIVKGDISAECFGERESIPYQGLFSGDRGEWPPDRVQSFVDRLSGLLPSFDRPAAVDDLVRRAIEAGYFTAGGKYPFGDPELEHEAERAYYARCQANDHPFILFQSDEAYIYCSHGKILSKDAVASVAATAARLGMGGPGEETDEIQFYPLEKNDRGSIPYPDFWDFAGELREILIDPRSYDPQPA